MDIVTEQRHQKELLMDQQFVSSYEKLNEDKPVPLIGAVPRNYPKGTERTERYCISIENEAIAAIQKGNLPEVDFQVNRLYDVNSNTFGKKSDCLYERCTISGHIAAIASIRNAPAEKRNYLLEQFLATRKTGNLDIIVNDRGQRFIPAYK